MCGIVGFVDLRHKLGEIDLQRMTASLTHRGPDDGGHFFCSVGKSSVGLGHRRLAILDLSANGRQPMGNDEVEIVYNGEVYNYKSLQSELKSCGVSFATETDTEVILKLFSKFGINCLHKLNGMFAFALYDKSKNDLYLVRDRAGVKPLYWMISSGGICFGSELKALQAISGTEFRLDSVAISQYFQYGYIPNPRSIYQAVQKLQPGSYLKYSIGSGEYRIVEYWNPINFYNQPDLKIKYAEALEVAEDLIKDACSLRLISDVPVGLFLSGGYDSSLVAAIVQSSINRKIDTFTVGFDEQDLDESSHARNVAKHIGTRHHEIICRPSDALIAAPKISYVWDEPFGDPSAIPTMLVSKFARESVTVSLSADGGDEIFGGYEKYLQIRRMSAIAEYPIVGKSLRAACQSIDCDSLRFFCRYPKLEKKLKKMCLAMSNPDPINILNISGSKFLPSEINEIVIGGYQSPNPIFVKDHRFQGEVSQMNRVLAVDYLTYQADDILAKVDRATMAFGLEGREPLLDYRILEFVARLPFEYKSGGGRSKPIVKDIVHKYIPKDIMERPKMGFTIPLKKWLSTEMRDLLEFHLSSEEVDRYGILKSSVVTKLRDRFLSDKIDVAEKIWLVLVFQMWCNRWVKQ